MLRRVPCDVAGCDAPGRVKELSEDIHGYAIWQSWCSQHAPAEREGLWITLSLWSP